MKSSYLIAGAILVGTVAWVLSGQLGELGLADRSAGATGPETATSATTAAQPAAAALPKVRVRRQTAEPRTAELVLRGRTAALRSVELRTETRGRVAEIRVEKGAEVEAGEVLLRLAADDRLARLRQAKALLAQRQIEFDNAEKLSAKGYRAETDVAAAGAQLEEAKAAVAAMEIEIGYLTMTAPFAGVIDARAVEIGDFVDVGDPVATIVDLDPILVVGDLAEQDVGKVRAGMPGTAELVTGETLAGTVRFVSAIAAEATRTFRLELEVPNADHRIPQGVSSDLRLPVANLSAHRVSPAILTLADNGDVGVKTLGPGDIVEFHTVTIVGDDADGVWLAGLPETVIFITVGQEFVTEGQRVEPVLDAGVPAS